MSTDPSRYVQPDVSELRINRLWSGVSERLERRQPRALRWLVLCGALCGVAGGVWLLSSSELFQGSSARTAQVDAKLQTAAEPLAVTLLDGSTVSLASRSELTVQRNQPTAVSLALTRGRADFDVAPQPARSFKVVAGDVEVRVVGTQFSVRATPEADGLRVEVSVLRGMVEVQSARRPGIVARVAAGQSWMQAASALPVKETATAAPAPPVGAGSQPEPSAAGVAAPLPSATVAPAARELFEKAGTSRRAGDAQGAARAYEELLRLHPGDARASLAAFELGRLRMDRLGDSAGAIAALERAVALNVGPTFREDALARLVSVYASQGNFAACGRARARYLASYPTGVHAAAVSTRCGGR
jgi:TolA-binding protein